MKKSILTIENKIINWIESHILQLAIAISLLLSLYVRFSNLNFQSNDAIEALIPWYDAIKKEGGFRTLYRQVGDYNIPYQTILAALTYLPIKALTAIKLVSCLFDYLLAFSIYKLTFLLTKNKTKATFCLIITLFLPIVALNSSIWAQCDSIYTFFIIMTILKLFESKEIKAFIFLGFAFSFKLQSIFIIPFILFYYVYKRRFSILHFLIIPLVMFLSSIAGVIHGRGLKEIIYIYYKQTSSYHYISLSYASIWNILEENASKANYEFIKPLAMSSSIIVIGLLVSFILLQKKELTRTSLLKIAFLLTYSCVFFLPSMHERYDYVYIIIGLVVTMLDYRYIPVFTIINYISTRCYGSYLFGTHIHDFNNFVILNLICYIATIMLTYIELSKCSTLIKRVD